MASSRVQAVVTGASSGIGAEFARKLARQGCDLVLVARRRGRLEDLAGELRRDCGVETEVIEADLTREDDLRRVAGRVAVLERLGYLINNAGFGTFGRFHEADAGRQEDMHRLHVLAAAVLTRAALPGMVARRGGAVVNVSSVAAFAMNPGSVSYCATKAWMNSFSEGLYLEMRAARIPVRVQALCPGFTYTEFHDVMGMDRTAVPKAWWMRAEDVVEESLRGLRENRLFVIPGARYRLLAGLLESLPRPLRHWLTLRFGSRHRRPVVQGRIPGAAG